MCVTEESGTCFPLSHTYQMTILVSTLIQSKAKVGENFSIIIAVKKLTTDSVFVQRKKE